MRGHSTGFRSSLAIVRLLLLCSLVIFICLPAVAQQTDINRYTVYTGFDTMISPARSLTEYGFDVDFGVTVKPWLGLGGDFGAFGNSIINGSGTINGSETVYAPTFNKLFGMGVPGVPPANAVNVPFTSTTYVFAAGPQFYWRKWKSVTFLGRPGFGGIHESANLTLPPGLGVLLPALGLPVPKANQSDLTWFIGLGGGADFNVSRRVGIRITADWVNTHLFSNLLTNRQNYMRFTIGPTWRWGQLK
jgi:hypothetical protein